MTQPKHRFSGSMVRPESFWEWVVQRRDFEKAMEQKGFFTFNKDRIVREFKEWYRKYGRGYASSNIPSFSVDFFSALPAVLFRNKLYPVPTGNGRCIIFDGSQYPAPYLWLSLLPSDAKSLPVVKRRKGYEYLLQAMGEQWNEQSFIKALHFSGAFQSLVRRICHVDDYQAGPSGPIRCDFCFWMRSKRGKLSSFMFDGMSDLDECLYPRGGNVVMPIEAKLTNYPDLAFYKLAFPCYRFIDEGEFEAGEEGQPVQRPITGPKKIIPVYCCMHGGDSDVYIYVFPQVKVRRQSERHFMPRSGLVLNDKQQLTFSHVFKVNLGWIG